MLGQIGIKNIVELLNNRNDEVVKAIDDLGFTSKGHEAEYYYEGRTIYKSTYVYRRYFNPEKVAVFTKAKAKEIMSELIKSEIDDTITYFKEAKQRVLDNKELAQ